MSRIAGTGFPNTEERAGEFVLLPMHGPATRGDLVGLAVELDLNRLVVEVLDDAAAVAEEIKPGVIGGAEIDAQRLEQRRAQRIEIRLPQLEQRLGFTADRQDVNARGLQIDFILQGLHQSIGQQHRLSRFDECRELGGKRGVFEGMDREERGGRLGRELVAGEERQTEHADEIEDDFLAARVAAGGL